MTIVGEVTNIVFSSGGGTQSAAIAALIVRGLLPKPTIAAIVDTGREASETWRYHTDVLVPALASVGVEYRRVPHSFATVDLLSGKDKQTIIMPMHTSRGGGVLPAFCSVEWKRRPFHRFCRSLGINSATTWIGYSIDEMERCRVPEGAWPHAYPLIERRMTRADSIKLVEDMGWPTPPRSSCYMCPMRSSQEFAHVKATDPDDFDKAVELERYLQSIDPDVYFHASKRPLDQVDFTDNQLDLFSKPCAASGCFT